jgi:hypothetical protein
MIIFKPTTPFIFPSKKRIIIEDHFVSGNTSTGSVGGLGWLASGTVTSISSTASHYGVFQLDTSTVSSTHVRISLHNTVMVDPAKNHTIVWQTAVNQVDANTTTRFGMVNSVIESPPSHGIYLEKQDADTNWFCVTTASGSSTRTDSGVAVSTNYIIFKYVRNSQGVQFYINDTLVATNTTRIPTTFLSPYLGIVNSAAASKTINFDYFSLLMTGLS